LDVGFRDVDDFITTSNKDKKVIPLSLNSVPQDLEGRNQYVGPFSFRFSGQGIKLSWQIGYFAKSEEQRSTTKALPTIYKYIGALCAAWIMSSNLQTESCDITVIRTCDATQITVRSFCSFLR
jgi:hypothetical protein